MGFKIVMGALGSLSGLALPCKDHSSLVHPICHANYPFSEGRLSHTSVVHHFPIALNEMDKYRRESHVHGQRIERKGYTASERRLTKYLCLSSVRNMN